MIAYNKIHRIKDRLFKKYLPSYSESLHWPFLSMPVKNYLLLKIVVKEKNKNKVNQLNCNLVIKLELVSSWF